MDFESHSQDNGQRNFQYSFYPGSGKSPYDLNLAMSVLSKETPEELAARVCHYHNIPCFVKADMSVKLREFKEKERINYEDSHGKSMIDWIREHPEMIGKVAKCVADKYEHSWMQHSKPTSTNLKDFSQSYHYLIHSSAMMILLELEKKYQQVITRMMKNRRYLMNNLQEKQQMEMSRVCEHVGFAYTQEDVLQITARHVDEMERLESQCRESYQKISGDQRTKFRQAVTRLADEMRQGGGEFAPDSAAYTNIKQLIEEAEENLRQNPHQQLFGAATDSNGSDTSRGDDVISPTSSRVGSSPSGSLGGAGSSDGIVHMEESFTVNLGNQLKTMHNLRLLVTDTLNYCRYADVREMEAQRFQTVMSLYSDSLSAVVLFTDNQLDYSIGIEQELANICRSTNEFHFDSLSTQLEQVKQSVREMKKSNQQNNNDDSSSSDDSEKNTNNENKNPPPTTSVKMNEGDLFVTRHSNLSQVHIVFHVVADTSNLKSKTSQTSVNSRHPIYQGLRHALKLASDYEIKTLTIPLLLAHEVNDDMTSQWCTRRAELVMKWMKGFMIEMASWDGGVSRNLQFVLPPGISEQCFDAIRSILPEVYRTTSTRNLTPRAVSRISR